MTQGVPAGSPHASTESGPHSSGIELPRDGFDLTIDDAVARIDALLSAGETESAQKLCSNIGLQCAPAVYAAGMLALSRRAVFPAYRGSAIHTILISTDGDRCQDVALPF
jgi:hypothetical protein